MDNHTSVHQIVEGLLIIIIIIIVILLHCHVVKCK